ncbi:MAG: 7TM diverse intracellular signaling domain-containing protein, partial [Ghiorsea sp.]
MVKRPLPKLQRLWICFAAIALSFAVLWLIHGITKPTNKLQTQLHLNTAECAFVPFNQAYVLQDLAWSTCALPDGWNTTHPDQFGDGWYKFKVATPDNASAMAVYLTSFSMNAEAWFNGMHIGSGGSFAEPMARNWNTPLFLPIPTSLLLPTANTLLVHVKGYANSSSGLGTIIWGEKEQLHPIFWQQYLLSQGLCFGIFTVSLLLGLVFLCLYLADKNITYLYFSLASLLSCVYVADIFTLYIPFSQHLWEMIVHSSILSSQYLFLIFILDTLKLRGKHVYWVKQFGLWHFLISVLFLVCSSDINFFSFAMISHSVGIVWLVYVSIYLWYYWYKTGVWIVLVFACAVFFEANVFIADWAPWVFGQGVTPPYIYPLGPMAFALAASSMLMVRFIASNHKEYELRQELKLALRKQKARLHEKHEKLSHLELQQAVQHEQDRITRELHDGLAAHLVGAQALLDSDIGQSKQLIEYSMDELRTLMDSLDADGDFLSKLGMMRHRLEDRLNAQHIYFDWQVWNLPEHMPQNPQTMHHTIRIVQESIHNIEKHAGANTIKVFVDLSGMVIQDDGHGFDIHHHAQGRGLKNIHWRAEQAHATLHITSNDKGT